MRNIWITVMYDGSSFAGFQRQENGLAVQEVLEQVLERLTGAKTTVYFVARTDAGVHAWAQECTFYTASSIPGDRFRAAMNAYLPLSVRVRESREMEEDFSVRKRNTGKTYGYLLSSARRQVLFSGGTCGPAAGRRISGKCAPPRRNSRACTISPHSAAAIPFPPIRCGAFSIFPSGRKRGSSASM